MILIGLLMIWQCVINSSLLLQVTSRAQWYQSYRTARLSSISARSGLSFCIEYTVTRLTGVERWQTKLKCGTSVLTYQWNVVPNQLSEHPVSTPSSNMELQLNLQMHVITSKSYSIELRHTYESTKLVNQNNSVTVATLVSLSDVYTRLAWLNLCRTSIAYRWVEIV